MIRFLIPSYAIYVVIGILSGALRGAGRVLVPMILTCGGVCLLRIIWFVCLCKISSGDRQYHAQLSGVLDNYCGTVCHLLFSAISRYAEKEITIYEKVLILCNSSDQHLCFVRKMSIYYV